MSETVDYPPAEELPIGTRITEPGIIGANVKYAPDRWARTSFDHGDAFINCVLRHEGVVVEIPDAAS